MATVNNVLPFYNMPRCRANGVVMCSSYWNGDTLTAETETSSTKKTVTSSTITKTSSTNSNTSSTNTNSSSTNGVQLKNANIKQLMEEDVLYHFGLSAGKDDLKLMFGDVKFVCIGGSARRMESFGHYLVGELGVRLPAGQTLCDISGSSDRYSLYKVGPVLSVSHGMGIPSVSIMLHEIFKLVFHAGCEDVTFFRIGTCGGLGITPGDVVISDHVVDGLLKPALELPVLGKLVARPAVFDKELAGEIKNLTTKKDGFKTIIGTTMCTNDFYEGQGRTDGAICNYSEEEKMSFLRHIYEEGVRNIEMESLCFAAMCHHVGVRAACVCVTLVDRLKGDQIHTPHSELTEWQLRPQQLITRYIKKELARTKDESSNFFNKYK